VNGFSYELAFAALLAVCGVAGVVFAARGSRTPRPSGGLCVAISVFLAAWLAGVLFMTLRPSSGRGALLNLVPLRFEGPGAVVDAVLNVGVFIPLGVLLAAAALRFPATLLIGLLLSAVIEVSQYFVQVGRTSDVNDLITNTTGTVLGWAIGAAIVLVCRRRIDG
jgi:glycopeptide antibiotics resistance protein